MDLLLMFMLLINKKMNKLFLVWVINYILKLLELNLEYSSADSVIEAHILITLEFYQEIATKPSIKLLNKVFLNISKNIIIIYILNDFYRIIKKRQTPQVNRQKEYFHCY
jgi:hypothetical protein